LSALIQGSGCVSFNIGTYTDSPSSIRTAFEKFLYKGVDLIIFSAGVSMGTYDFIRSVIEQEGTLKLWRVNMRPGKPIVFGAYKTIPFIGLPGNPVSAFIRFEVFVKHVLNLLSGIEHFEREMLRIRLSHSIESDGSESYLRGNISKKNGERIGTITEH